MKNPANFLNHIFVVLALTTSACIGQITKSQNQKSASTVENGIVGGGCDGCELMYVGMPKEIKSVDYSPGWTEKGDKGSTVPMSPANWETKDTTKKYEMYLGQPSMFLQSGTALVKNSNFEDGVIEVDVATPNPRAFAGIAFRAQSGEELELVYLRLFKPAFSDAVQYVPRFHNVDAWQLYNAGYTAEANFKKDSWTRLKIQIEGRSARVFVNNAEKPSLLIEDLKRDEGKGLVGLWGLNGAYFANFSYTSRPLPSGLVKPKNGFQPGMIERWDVSQEFSLSDVNFENYPTGNQLDKIKWERLDAEKPGFINFSRYRRKMHIDAVPFKNSDDVVYSRKKIVSSKDQTKKMFFGYSDRIAVFLNGKIIFAGNSAFRSRYDQYLGALGLHDAVYLDLKKGENELLFLVTDKMGGWGMQAQFPDTKGIEF